MVGQGTELNQRAPPEHSSWGPPSAFSLRFWVTIRESMAREFQRALASGQFFEHHESQLKTHPPPWVEIRNIYLLYTHSEDNYKFSTVQPNPTRPTLFNTAQCNTAQRTQGPELEQKCVCTCLPAMNLFLAARAFLPGWFYFIFTIGRLPPSSSTALSSRVVGRSCRQQEKGASFPRGSCQGLRSGGLLTGTAPGFCLPFISWSLIFLYRHFKNTWLFTTQHITQPLFSH